MFLAISGCSSLSKPTPTTIELTHDMSVIEPHQPKQELKKGKKIELNDEPLIFESSGHVSVMVVPTKETKTGLFGSPIEKRPKSQIKLTLKEDPRLNPDKVDAIAQCEKKEAENMNSLLSEVENVQELMAASSFRLALEKISQLQARYPAVTYLNFLKGSVLVLSGQHNEAKIILEKSMREFPQQKMAKDLLMLLTNPEGHARVPASMTPEEERKK